MKGLKCNLDLWKSLNIDSELSAPRSIAASSTTTHRIRSAPSCLKRTFLLHLHQKLLEQLNASSFRASG